MQHASPSDDSLPAPVRVGLVGAGPWARAMHARMLAAGPETTLTAVWARRPEAAQETAAPYGAKVAASFDELLEQCEAVAFAVPPGGAGGTRRTGREGGPADAAGEAARPGPRIRPQRSPTPSPNTGS